MALIRYKEGILCDDCEKLVRVGEDVFETRNGFFYCEDCYDKYQRVLKSETRTKVSNDNFELEEEIL